MDYNDPHAPAEEIGGSIRALFSTGATRFYATVITGAPDAMCGSLRGAHAHAVLARQVLAP